jgi:hypothetical protein
LNGDSELRAKRAFSGARYPKRYAIRESSIQNVLRIPAMSFFDFIRELRKGEPDVKKAAKAMKILGWICVFGAIWNFVIFYLAPFDKSPFNLPESYPYLVLIIFLSLGAIFLFSARGIKERAPWGKQLGQLAVILLVAIVIGAMFFIFPAGAIPSGDSSVSIIFIIFMAVFFAQFGVPAYFGVRYLGRLPVKDDGYPDHRFEPTDISKVTDDEVTMGSPTTHHKYKDSLLPFGILGTFPLLIAVPLLTLLIIEKYAGPEKLAFMFMLTFLFIFLGPVAYNFVPSPFERERSLIASYTGGGSIFLFGGTWPFFRFMIYRDGIEIRVMLHRFFIPYDKMDDVPPKIGFFSRGLLIKSDLSGVPSSIRFYGFGMKKIVEVVNENRNKYLTTT